MAVKVIGQADSSPDAQPTDPSQPRRSTLRVIGQVGEPSDKPAADPGAFSTYLRNIPHGLMDLVYGGVQLGARMGPEEGAAAFTDPTELERRKQVVDQATRQRAADIAKEPGQAEHPLAAGLGGISGQILGSSPLFALPGALPTLGARMAGAGVAGSLLGAMQPATSEDVGGEKALSTGVGAVTSAIGQPIGEGLALGGRALYRAGQRAFLGEEEAARQAAEKAAKTTARAQKVVGKKLQEGGASATDILKDMQEAREAGQPYSLLDVGSEPVERLAGTLYRSQTGRQAQALKGFQEGRISSVTQLDPETHGTAQYGRLLRGIRNILGTGSVTEATERLGLQRATNARPLWDKALSMEAVWNPHIQRLLDRPDVQRGIRIGAKIEADKAAAANIPFDPHSYAIVGFNAAGDPILDKVPNMRLLQMAKEGLDAMLEGAPVRAGETGEAGALRDPITRKLTKAGLAVDQMRRALLENMDAINPDYATARAQWSGDTASMEALKDGQVAFTDRGQWSVEDFRTRWREMNPSDRELFKLGAADTLIQGLDFSGMSGFENKVPIRSTATLNKLHEMFRDSPGDVDRFINFIERERQMYRVGGRVMKGSQTAGREAADIQNLPGLADKAEAARHGLASFLHLHAGNPLHATLSGLRARQALGWTGQNPQLNEEIMRILTAPATTITDPTTVLSRGPAGELIIGSTMPQPAAGPARQYLGAYGTGLPGRWIAPGMEELFATPNDQQQ